MVERNAEVILSQMRRGAIEFCVLALLTENDHYGFELVKMLTEAGGLVTSEGTIYPLLTRLLREDLVETYVVPSSSGPDRRYYRITPSGRTSVGTFMNQWIDFRESVDQMMQRVRGPETDD